MPTVPLPLASALADRYRIEREIGRGGMAVVYLAEDLKHGRRVAIKVLTPEIAAAIGREHFLREIEIAARLNHPHILPLHDSGAADGELYFVMPFIEGGSLRARLQREGPLPLDEALRLSREIASALGHAHHRGLIHRDVKPENVLLSEGFALLSDFGIARPTSASGGSLLTVADMRLGTPLYMAPEQALGKADLDGRADVYSLGCVLYEMLAGQPPFAGSSDSLLYQHISVEPRPVTELRLNLPGGIVAVLRRALAKAPADRFATAARFVEALSVATLQTPLSVAVDGEPAVPNNLQRDRTSFVGRERDLRECTRLMEETRLLTLTGVGGCGKTRLAIQLARTLLRGYPDGVWFVDLAPASEPERVAQSVAATLNVKEGPGVPLAATLVRHLGQKRILLVLDNCEHLLSASAQLVDELLTGCAELRMVVTSREGLGVEGERPFALRSLSVPEANALKDPREIGATEAVRLFVDRARIVAHGFVLDENTAPAVAEICRRLDGIPLAIELAAARMKMLSVEQIRSMLDDRFKLLTGGNRALPRHQTLRATIQWSYDHLSPELQRMFRILAVFVGGCTLDAATAVADEGADEFEVLDLLTRLADKSLLDVDREGDLPRYRMLETMRQFAQERLDASGQGDGPRSRHLDHFLAGAEEVEPVLLRSERGEELKGVDREIGNILAALAWCDLADGGAEKGIRLTGALRAYWESRGLLELGLRSTGQALARDATEAVTLARGKALSAAGQLAYFMGNREVARAYLERAVAISRSLGVRSVTARSLAFLGALSAEQGERDVARAYLNEALTVAQEARDRVTVLDALGVLLLTEGNTEQAAPLYEEALVLSREIGSAHHIAGSLYNLNTTCLSRGDLAPVRNQLLEALDLVEKAGLTFVGHAAVAQVAGLAAARGEAEHAGRFWGAAKAMLERTGGKESESGVIVLAPLVARAEEQIGEAAFAFRYEAGQGLSDAAAISEARAWLRSLGSENRAG